MMKWPLVPCWQPEKLAKDEDLLIVGIDATPDALEYLGKVGCNSLSIGIGARSTSVEMAYKAVMGESSFIQLDSI